VGWELGASLGISRCNASRKVRGLVLVRRPTLGIGYSWPRPTLHYSPHGVLRATGHADGWLRRRPAALPAPFTAPAHVPTPPHSANAHAPPSPP
jgi:hypothetical protein